MRGQIFERDVLIGTFKRGPVENHFVPPIEYKFYSTQSKHRFDDIADCLGTSEIIEALLPL